MVFPPSQVFGAEYLADDRVGVVQVTDGHVHLTDHAQLLARHLGQIDVRPDRRERVAATVAARRRAVGPVQPEIVHGPDPFQPGRRVRPVALVRRTVIPVRVDFRVGRHNRRGAGNTAEATAASRDRDGILGGHDGHGGHVPVTTVVRRQGQRHATTGAARAARATFPCRRLRPQTVHGDRTTHRASRFTSTHDVPRGSPRKHVRHV